MMRLRSGFIAFSALAAFSAAAGSLPCEPSPDCALRMTRDLTMKIIRPAGADDELLYAIGMLEWAQGVSPEPDAKVRARFATLDARIKKMSDAKDRALAERWLGIFMAKSGFMPEATEFAARLETDSRNVVYSNIAEEHARRGRWREAFKAVVAIRDENPNSSGKFFALYNSLKSVARTGRPEYIEEAASWLKDPPPAFIPTGLAYVDLAAGRDDAAIQGALQHTDINTRMSVLVSIVSWYQDEKRDLDVLRVQRIELEQMRKLGHQDWFDHVSESYFKGLVEARQYSQALAWAPEVHSEDRDMKLSSLFLVLRKPEDIAEATKLLPLMKEWRDDAEEALVWARIASGLVDPTTGFKSVANPGDFARNSIDRLRDFDPELKDQGRAIIAAAVDTVAASPSKRPFADMFYPWALARAQIKFGLLEDARKTLDAMTDPRARTEQLLALSVAQSRAGQTELARTTKAEAMSLLAQLDSLRQPDLGAEILLRAGMPDDAEAALRRLMVPDPMPPAFIRVAMQLTEEWVKRGDLKRAFQLAADWSALDGDPEAIAYFYSARTNSRHPPPNFSRTLKRYR